MNDYYPIERGRTYRWRNTELGVQACTHTALCMNPDNDFYREYTFEALVLQSDNPRDLGTTIRCAACQGWEPLDHGGPPSEAA